MTDFGALFDSYGRKARLYPALLTLLPAVAVAFGWLATWPSTTAATLVTIASACGLFYALASIARSAGKRVEKRLLAEQGGWHTTTMLRHRDPALSAATKERYHQFLQQPVGGLPTAAQETAAPAEADEKYASAILWLKEQRRGPQFQLVHRENAEYGFRRNLRGLKRAGVTLCLLALVGWVGVLFLQHDIRAIAASSDPLAALWNAAPIGAWAALAVAIIGLLSWIVVVRDRWVREASVHYATALLATCDTPAV